MATNPTLTYALQPDGTYQVTVAFDLRRPVTAHLTLSLDGGPSTELDINDPGEPFPAVKIAGDPTIDTAVDWVLGTDAGTITATADQGVFSLLF